MHATGTGAKAFGYSESCSQIDSDNIIVSGQIRFPTASSEQLTFKRKKWPSLASVATKLVALANEKSKTDQTLTAVNTNKCEYVQPSAYTNQGRHIIW